MVYLAKLSGVSQTADDKLNLFDQIIQSFVDRVKANKFNKLVNKAQRLTSRC